MTHPLLGRTDLIGTAEVDGQQELTLSSKAIAYLLNMDEEEINAEFRRQRTGDGPQTMRMPKLWRVRSQENIARLGTDDFTEILELMVAEREGADR